MKIRIVLTSAVVASLAATAASGQDLFTQAVGTAGQPATSFMVQAPAPGEMGIVALDALNVGRAVLNAPYTAEAVTEVTQLLADGNRIEQRTSATIARDSRGRTRREQEGIALGTFVAKNPQPIVTITDPETGVHITLNYEAKVAFRSKPLIVRRGEEKPALPPPPEAGAIMTAPALEMAFEPADVITSGTVIALPIDPPAAEREALESKIIDGIKVEGVRRTVTIAAGAIGNVQPLELVIERWFSPELQVVVMTRRYDPRFGETIYRLTNIQREEPAADLFRIPSDFRIEDMRPGVMMPVRPDGQ